ncbi:MgtC/SapB family protein [Aquabacter sp. P-9]|uniref:MgtC/SapB family protein n=1 Tax=Aquabacter sediminis TaxID=3029197 RepID=UPI00237D52B0|nr:MgtC/SapB family protein [Aquabacter sp. P-9]MDE1570290.1 MgtC/SapB family protein [Aquabacter sp. P-9]
MLLATDWTDIALRLGCTFVAGALVGLDRESRERAAGLRTNILVSLAACIAMLSAALLVPMSGKQPTSFIQLDVMRLPLGILTGMGFIGAGAIIRRADGLVLGVTTAATLWYVTVMGLCFGAGQFVLGGAALVLALATLWGMKFFEARMRHQKEGRLLLRLSPSSPGETWLKGALLEAGLQVRRISASIEPATGLREYRFELWCPPQTPMIAPDFVRLFAETDGVERVEWEIGNH